MSSRRRVYLVVGLLAVAAGGVAAVVAWTGRAQVPAAPAAGPREGNPPLALDVLVDDVGEARALQGAAQLYQEGRLTEARTVFERVQRDDPGSLYAAVGAAFARWPQGTVGALRELEQAHPASGLVRLHLGLALFWQGMDDQAQAAWRETEQVDPDSAAALRAESLLHPDMPAGRPFFVPATGPPESIASLPPLAQLAELEKRAMARDDAESWLLDGVALQRAGRPLSAEKAFDRAAALAPDDPEALTAAALVRFTKDDPSQAFSRLGPLSRRFPDAPVVRFHLGLALLWLRDVEDARPELEAAVSSGSGTVWGREAQALLDRLDGGS